MHEAHERIRSRTPTETRRLMGERDFFFFRGIMCLWREAFVLSSPLCDEGERLGIYSALFKREISCLLTSTL